MARYHKHTLYKTCSERLLERCKGCGVGEGGGVGEGLQGRLTCVGVGGTFHFLNP